MQDIYKRWFERTLQNAVNTVHNNSLGNYTNSYNTWKRLESIRSIYKEETNEKKGGLCILDAGMPFHYIASLLMTIQKK